jgi:type VI secretion system ImpA family protein
MASNDFQFRYDIDKLLSPISSDNPAGASLLYDPVYDQLRELRREDENDLPQGVWKSDPKKGDWKGVEDICLELLETRTKDLQIAAWLLEAWIRLHGFAGATEGFNVIRALCDSFWDVLHPLMNGGDAEYRIAPFDWINRKIVIDLKLIPLTEPDSDAVKRYSWSDWENACLASKSGHAGSPKSITVAKFQQSVMLTPTVHLYSTLDTVRRTGKVVGQLDALLDQKMRMDAPGLSPIKDLAASILSFLSQSLELRGEHPDDHSTEPLGSVWTAPAAALPSSSSVLFSAIRSRAQAYQVLAEAAEYLSRTEPHSPVPFLVRRAISWGTMPLDVLMAELVRSPNDLSEISRLLSFGDTQTSKSK